MALTLALPNPRCMMANGTLVCGMGKVNGWEATMSGTTEHGKRTRSMAW